MILVGELEFNEDHFHPCGGPQSFLFVNTHHTFVPGPKPEVESEYKYAIAPTDNPKWAHIGDVFVSSRHLSVTQFLQRFVDVDERIGRGVIKSLERCKVRLKGMSEWIERKPLAKS